MCPDYSSKLCQHLTLPLQLLGHQNLRLLCKARFKFKIAHISRHLLPDSTFVGPTPAPLPHPLQLQHTWNFLTDLFERPSARCKGHRPLIAYHIQPTAHLLQQLGCSHQNRVWYYMRQALQWLAPFMQPNDKKSSRLMELFVPNRLLKMALRSTVPWILRT